MIFNINFSLNYSNLFPFNVFRRTRCNPKENFHKMGQQTFEKGNSRFFFLKFFLLVFLRDVVCCAFLCFFFLIFFVAILRWMREFIIINGSAIERKVFFVVLLLTNGLDLSRVRLTFNEKKFQSEHNKILSFLSTSYLVFFLCGLFCYIFASAEECFHIHIFMYVCVCDCRVHAVDFPAFYFVNSHKSIGSYG